MNLPISFSDAWWLGVGTTVGVVATAVAGYLGVRHTGLTQFSLAKLKAEQDFLLMVLTRLREVEQINKGLQDEVLEMRDEKEAEALEKKDAKV